MATISKTPAGRWRVRKSVGGKRLTGTFDTQMEARAWAKQRSTTDQRPVPFDSVRYDEWVHSWFNGGLAHVQATTLDTYRSRMNSAILPYWGNVYLEEITRDAIQRWMAETLVERYTQGGARQTSVLFLQSLEAARLAGYIKGDKIENLKLPFRPREKKIVRPLDRPKVQALTDAMPEHLRASIPLMAYCGLRIGEVLALKRENVDLEDRTIFVGSSMRKVRGKGLVVGSTKTRRSTRTITMDKTTLAEVTRHIEAGWAEGELFFTGKRGGKLAPGWFRERPFKKALGVAKLPSTMTPHDLRHSAVSLWIKAGASPLDVANRAGHTSVSSVFDIYGHLYVEDKYDLADKLNAAFDIEDEKLTDS